MMNGLKVLKWKTQNCIKPESLYLHHNSQFCTVLVCLCLCQREREKERERRVNCKEENERVDAGQSERKRERACFGVV